MKKNLFTILFLAIAVTVFGQITQKRDVSGFTKIDASSAFNITVAKGATESLTITTDEDMMPRIRCEVRNGTLYLSIKVEERKRAVITMGLTDVQITMRDLERVKLSGACKLESSDVFEPANFEAGLTGASNLKLDVRTKGKVDVESSGASKVEMKITAASAEFDISGACKAKLTVQAPVIEFDVSGASNIELAGTADRLKFDGSGVSKLKAFDLVTKRGEIKISGASNAEVHATETLSLKASGTSSLSYKGTASIDHIETSGASRIRKVN